MTRAKSKKKIRKRLRLTAEAGDLGDPPSAGYVLLVPPGRREILIWSAQELGHAVSQAVPRFDYKRGRQFPVFASFAEGYITHVMEAHKGSNADTGRVRLNLSKWLRIDSPIPFDRVVERVSNPLRSHLRRIFETGGMVPPKTLTALVGAVVQLAPETAGHLNRYSEESIRGLAELTRQARVNLALQKEAVAVSISIAGLERDDLLEWTPRAGARSFLDGLPGAVVREDNMLVVDSSIVPGFELEAATQIASKTFERATDGTLLTVVMANRTALEEQTGADLIYVNETYRSVVFVQYKAMAQEGTSAIFRWRDDPSDDLVKEIARMDTLLSELAKLPDTNAKESFRLHDNPFLLKFCPKVVLDPHDTGLIKGMYVPLEYWKRFETDSASFGPKGGRIASFENVGRWLNNTEFIALVAGAWIGATIPQGTVLQELIRRILATQKTVTFAIERKAPPPGHFFGQTSQADPLEGMDVGEEDEEEPPLLA